MERHWELAAAWLLAGLAHRWWSGASAGSLRHAVSDGLSHLAFGLATSLPAARRVSAPERLLAGALAGALAIDLDHVVAARSFRLRDCATMPQRPTTHSLPVAGALTALALRRDRCFGVGFGLGLASHLL
ncbi:MAG: metal-dependent hydrolase, partial [Thermomicrobium sp.]|nr:metal-dependent hydrolase [Thermomicrobium sp.]